MYEPEVRVENEVIEVPLDAQLFIAQTGFITEANKMYGRRLLKAAADRMEYEQRYPFAAKINASGFVDAADSYRRAKQRNYQYLVEEILQLGSYGSLFAEYKAGKTWLVLDLVVNLLAGGAFLGKFHVVKPVKDDGTVEEPRVMLFAAEGDENEFWRRFDAICGCYGYNPEDLLATGNFVVQFRAPDLSSKEDIERVHQKLQDFKPHLTIIDPWYLAAGSEADHTNLNKMGVILRNIQGVCQDVGSGLLIIHHWNQTGSGDGFNRGAGAGLQEWGRFLVNMSVTNSKGGDPNDIEGKTEATIRLEFKGQISGAHEFTREVWTDDRKDLKSDMHYSLDNKESVRLQSEGKQDERTLEVRIMNAVFEAVKANDGLWNKTQVVASVTDSIKVRKLTVSQVVNFIERYRHVSVTEKKWGYMGDDYVDRVRSDFEAGLNENWNEFVKNKTTFTRKGKKL